jgi:4-amino-4-deoxy-L-arabinose transferase-like glycosyltransferase
MQTSASRKASDERTVIRFGALVLLATIVLRLVAAASTPLMVDEAYYWTWSRRLAAGYYDHPPLVAYVIRLGTLLAGDTEFGVRVLFVLMAIPMSVAVYRTGVILLGSVQAGVTAALMLNATMMVSAGTLMASPDAPLMLAFSLTLLALAKVWQSGNGTWWLLAGASVGLAMLSKLNGLVLGPVILLWLVAVRELRGWLASPWPYLGGAAAFAMFMPTLIWNAQHEWVSFTRQLSRAVVDGGFRPKFLAEFVGGQILLATPAVYLLGVSGLYALLRRPVVKPGAAWLIDAMVWPITIYFVLHALRGGVHPNWLAQIYPAFAVAAALAVHHVIWPPFWQRLVDWSNRSAAIVGFVLFAVVFVQINTGWFSASRKDPLAHLMAVGFHAKTGTVPAIDGRPLSTHRRRHRPHPQRNRGRLRDHLRFRNDVVAGVLPPRPLYRARQSATALGWRANSRPRRAQGQAPVRRDRPAGRELRARQSFRRHSAAPAPDPRPRRHADPVLRARACRVSQGRHVHSDHARVSEHPVSITARAVGRR